MPTLPARAALAAGLILTLGRAAGAGPDRPPPPPAALPIATVVGSPAGTTGPCQVVQIPPQRVIVEVPPPNVVYRTAAPAPPGPPQTHGLFARFCPCRTHAARRPTCPGPRVACAPAPTAGDPDAALRQATAQLAAITQALEANTRALTNHEQRLRALEGWARSYDPTGKTFPRPFPAPAGQPAPIPIAPTNTRR